MAAPKQGDLVTINFNPQAGHEQAGLRPAIVLSHETFNQKTGFAIICPITKQKKGYPFEVAIPSGLQVTGVILTDQLRSLDWKARGLKVIDEAPKETVQECLNFINLFW